DRKPAHRFPPATSIGTISSLRVTRTIRLLEIWPVGGKHWRNAARIEAAELKAEDRDENHAQFLSRPRHATSTQLDATYASVQSAYHLHPICKANLYKRKVTTANLVHKLSPCSAQCECACLVVIDATQKLAV